MRTTTLVSLTVLAMLVAALPAQASGVVTIENRSGRAIKAAAPGGSAVVPPGTPPMPIRFETGEPVGVMLQIWWVDNVREFCRVFAAWDRTVVVTGERTINCLTHD